MAAIIAADMGDDEAAQAYAERAWAGALKLGQLVLTAWAQNALGVAAMRRGDLETALEWYDQYVPLVRDTENAVSRHLALAYAAEAYMRAGRLDEAARLAARAVEHADFAGAPHFRALGRSVQGELYGAQQRYDEAFAALDEAIAIFAETGSGLELARARFHRAELKLLRGEANDIPDAKAEIARARDSFTALGARRDHALAERKSS